MATPTSTTPPRRITDLQRSAFWIYGVTAMVMREPFGLLIRHATDAGLANWQVRLEFLRIAVILVLLARLFLVSGLYFEAVYMAPDSSRRYPRRSYPIDFLAGLAQFLVGAAATTTVGIHTRVAFGIAPFTLTAILFLLVDPGWLALAILRRFSTVEIVRSHTIRNLAIIALAVLALGISRLAGMDAVFADQTALVAILVAASIDIASQVRTYESLDR